MLSDGEVQETIRAIPPQRTVLEEQQAEPARSQQNGTQASLKTLPLQRASAHTSKVAPGEFTKSILGSFMQIISKAPRMCL